MITSGLLNLATALLNGGGGAGALAGGRLEEPFPLLPLLGALAGLCVALDLELFFFLAWGIKDT
jgi:hypothetical protein